MSVAGASRYLGAATLANVQGLSPSNPTLLDGSGGIAAALESSRPNNGIGLSAQSRALTRQFLNETSSGFNTVFSLSNGVEFGTEETLQQKILAIRASIPESQLSREVRGENVDTEA